MIKMEIESRGSVTNNLYEDTALTWAVIVIGPSPSKTNTLLSFPCSHCSGWQWVHISWRVAGGDEGDGSESNGRRGCCHPGGRSIFTQPSLESTSGSEYDDGG